jgi:archaellin
VVYAFVVPIKTLGVRYVPMAAAKSEVTLRIEQHTAIADVYHGINTADPTLKTLDALQLLVTDDNTAELFIGNSDLDSSLDYDEKGFLVFQLGSGDEAAQRDHVFVEIRPEKGAPLTLEFIIPPQLTQGWHTIGS